MSRAALLAGTAALATLAALGAALPARAADVPKVALRPGMGGVADIGAMGCESYTLMHAKGPSGTRQATLYWFEGLVWARSGKSLDAFLAGTAGGTGWDFERLTGHVVDWCAANPARTVAAAAEDLWRAVGAPGSRPPG